MTCIFPIVWVFRKIGARRQARGTEDARTLALREFRVIPVINGLLTGNAEPRNILAQPWVALADRYFVDSGREKALTTRVLPDLSNACVGPGRSLP